MSMSRLDPLSDKPFAIEKFVGCSALRVRPGLVVDIYALIIYMVLIYSYDLVFGVSASMKH
ncbi:hypothetical protein [Corallincola spongiicola]|uniref:Uncharacterized protein n=1 Tax=Corallincola spongiicola TaxID=2520508 RepID=A0ABY1WLC6_9GAMM|nr:hypothetical protein [Corallincola spongiicola]TAA41722.1 hypothetical protein EXY25_15890 [Corallincola spongiicola]